jgi:hypothetical protein
VAVFSRGEKEGQLTITFHLFFEKNMTENMDVDALVSVQLAGKKVGKLIQ